MARDYKSTSQKAEKQGSGVGGGPVGSSGGYSGRPGGGQRPASGQRPSGANPGGPNRPNTARGVAGGSNGSGLLLAAIAYLLLGKKSNGQQSGGLGKLLRLAAIVVIALAVLKSCSGGGYDTVDYGSNNYNNGSGYSTVIATPAPTPRPTPRPTPAPTPVPTQQPAIINSSSYSGSYANNSWFSGSGNSFGGSSSSTGFDLSSIFGGNTNVNSGAYSTSGWVNGSNCGSLNTSVIDGSRAKYTNLKGNGQDTVTIMVYMCGTDLESNYGMGTNDLQEMANAAIGSNVNLIVYTGGCTGWKNSLMSSRTNQIYKIENGGQFRLLVQDAGNKAMVAPGTLTEFIQFCKTNFPADRNMLIFWDHGGGSLSGYGYDQRFKSSGSMTLDEIDAALAQGGVKFDVIGFDACLMATVETAQMAAKYGDYLIASEESEPGIGWYYTNWLTMLSKDTSVPTLQIGKQIADDFVAQCNKQCAGQDTTLSVTDLAELSYTVPGLMKTWSADTTGLIKTDYRTVSNARGKAKEFAASSKIDQADLTNLCLNLNNESSRNLASALLSAVKYNRTSSTVKNAYGLSIYFPYRSVSSVKTAVNTYNELGMDSSYAECIKAYASYASSGQAAAQSSGYSSALGSLLSGYGGSSSYGGSSYGGSSYTSSYSDADLIYALLEQMMGGRSLSNVAGLTEDNSSFLTDAMSDGTVDARSVAQYVSDNTFDASALSWAAGADGTAEITLPKEQWGLVSELKLSVFRNDGKGFIDLGLDLYDGFFKSSGALKGEYDGGWLAINGQEVAYYQQNTLVAEDGTAVTYGRVPCLYNGQRANLIIETVNDEPAVVGVVYDYQNDADITTCAKTFTEYNANDRVVFLADYYTYDNVYENTYRISDEFSVGSGLTAEYAYVADPAEISACYRFTDIYGKDYWTPVMALAE